MKKYIRKIVKDEKRILKLMYKKGVIDKYVHDLKHCCWESIYNGKRGRRRKNKSLYATCDFIPQFHLYTVDYWGEGDSHSIVEAFKEDLAMKDAEFCQIKGWLNVNRKVNSNKWIITHLKSLPTVRNDSKFNKCLKLSY